MILTLLPHLKYGLAMTEAEPTRCVAIIGHLEDYDPEVGVTGRDSIEVECDLPIEGIECEKGHPA